MRPPLARARGSILPSVATSSDETSSDEASSDRTFCADMAGRLAGLPGVRADAQSTLGYARAAHARSGQLADTAGAIATAACQAAHSVLAARGQWVTDEKNLLERAGLRGIDGVLAGLTAEPGHLLTAVAAAGTLLRAAVQEPAGS